MMSRARRAAFAVRKKAIIFFLFFAAVLFLHGQALAAPQLNFNYLSSINTPTGDPVRVAADNAGILYVAAPGAGAVLKYTQDGSFVGSINGFKKPISVAVDGNNRIYVGDFGDGSVTVVDSDGRALLSLGNGTGEFGMPGDMAIASNGSIYVTDSVNNVVKVYASDGSFKSSFGGFGTSPGKMMFPTGVACDNANQEVYVVDSTNGRVEVFDFSGAYKRTFGSFGSGQGKLTRPQGIHVANGRVYVTDCYQSTVQVLDTVGNFLAFIGQYGDGQGQLKIPMGAAVVGTTLFVSNTDNRRLEVFNIVDPQGLSIMPLTLTFSAMQNSNPAPQTIQVNPEVAGSQIPWTATMSSPFNMSIDQASGTAPSTVTVTVNAAGLSAGAYSGTINFSANNVNYPVTVNVIVQALPPQLVVSPGSITMTYQDGTSGSQTISVGSSGGILSWSAATNVSWVTLTPASGTTPGSITAALNQTEVNKLKPGTYSALITVTAPNALGSPASIPVTATISCPKIAITPLTVPDGTQGTPYNQTFAQTGGVGTVTFGATGTLPDGMNLSGSGVLSGTPTTPGTYGFIVTATDANACTGSQSYSIHITSGSCTPAPSGMVAWWSGDGNANDSVSGNNGTLMNAATYAPGEVRQAFSLGGVNDYVSVGVSTSVSKSPASTVEAWVYPASVVCPQGFAGHSIYAEGDSGSASYQLTLRCDGLIDFAVWRSDVPGNWTTVTSSTVLSPDNWYHVAGTLDSSGMKIYVNGVLENANSSNLPSDHPISEIDIGRVGDSGGNDYFSGLIDELKIYNRALSQEEIQAIYDATSLGVCAVVTTPAPFTFTDQFDVPLNTLVMSNSIAVQGTNYASPISITGGEYEVNGSGAWLSTQGWVNSGDSIIVSLMSSGSYGTTTSATLTIGGVSGTFNVRTVCPTITVSPAVLAAGSVGVGYSPVTFTSTGGAGPVTFNESGTLPSGMTFSGGVLSGTPTQAGSFPITVIATDQNGCTGSASMILTVQQELAGTIVVSTNLDNASFSISGPGTFSGSGMSWTQDNAPAGTYTIQFDFVKGYRRPAKRSFDVKIGEVATIDVQYQQLKTANMIAAAKGPGAMNDDLVRVLDQTGVIVNEFHAFPRPKVTARFGVKVAMADIDGDGTSEIITVPGVGPQNQAAINVFRQDGTLLSSVNPISGTIYGADIAVGDILGNGIYEVALSIVTTSRSGRTTMATNTVVIYQFNGFALTEKTRFDISSSPTTYGPTPVPANLAFGDLDGDGIFELIVANRGEVRVYAFDDTLTPTLVTSASGFVPSAPGSSLEVSSGDVDGDGIDEVIVGFTNGTDAYVGFCGEDLKVKDGKIKTFVKEKTAPNLSAMDWTGDGASEVLVGLGADAGNDSTIRVYDVHGTVLKEIRVFDRSVKYGVNAAFGVKK